MLKEKINYDLNKKLKGLHGKKVRIGIVGESDSKLLTIAAVNEYGANIEITPDMRKFLPTIGINVKKETTHIVIPERSYIRTTFDNKAYWNKLKKQLESLFSGVLNNENEPYDLLEAIGLIYVANTKNTIRNMTEPENHPVTIKRKGSGKGLLVNTGRLFNAISFEVMN